MKKLRARGVPWLIAAAGAALLLAAVLFVRSRAAASTPYTATFWDVFDTVVTVTGYAESETEWNAQMDALHADFQKYNRLFDIYNAYDGVNNLYTVNAGAGKAPVAVDSAVMTLLSLGKEMYTVTNGKCNIAGGAVLSLWHDARTAGIASPETAALPDEAALKAAAAHCGIDDLVLDTNAGTVYLADPAMSVDVGSIAKGWSTEAVAQAAQARGLTSALINAGGNLRAIGAKPDGSAWIAGVENPWPDENGTYNLSQAVVRVYLQDGESLVVSGDYERYYTVDGVPYCHLIDPATLYPARYVNSVAVLCKDSGRADALSTGLFCTPVADGQALVGTLDGVEAMWLQTDRITAESAGFAGHLVPEN